MRSVIRFVDLRKILKDKMVTPMTLDVYRLCRDSRPQVWTRRTELPGTIEFGTVLSPGSEVNIDIFGDVRFFIQCLGVPSPLDLVWTFLVLKSS